MTVVGVDVGARTKGYHAVALRDGVVDAKVRSADPRELARWCRDRDAEVVAVDAPCRWRSAERPRLAERELVAEGIGCFATPTKAKARGHAFYTWMFAGEALYRELAPFYTLYAAGVQRRQVVFETFPHAIACALANRRVAARDKVAVRSALLRDAGLDVEKLAGIDELDAALCALAALSFVCNRCKAYGDAESGFIVVPTAPCAVARFGEGARRRRRA